MGIYWTPFVDVGVDTSIFAANDALGAKNSFTNIPEHGTIMAVSVIDRDSEDALISLVLFHTDIAGSAANAAFAPSDAELSTCVAAISVPVANYFTFDTNSIAIVDNIGLPYWTPGGVLFWQLVNGTGTPTYTAATDLLVALGIVY